MLLRLLFIKFLLAMTAFSQVPSIEPGVSHDLARWRSVQYSDIRYKLNLTLEKMSPVLKGTIEIRLQQAASACAEPNCPPMAIILDWRKIAGHEKDSTISNVSINGKAAALSVPGAAASGMVSYAEASEHLIFRDGVVMGENVIKLDFTSPILTSGSAITRYVDKEDGAEYIYSLFVPSDASTAFPVFDQPDLKARFSLTLWRSYSSDEKNWSPISNTNLIAKKTSESFRPPDLPANQIGHWWATVWAFEETKPISTYVFAFAAGPFETFADKGGNLSGSEGVAPATLGPTDKNTLPTGRVSASDANPSSHIYVRKSQAAKFQPHAADVFRLTREGVKYLETYFDYKFPFPKYDLVLIPEFPFGGMEHAGATFLKESSVIFPTEPTKNDQISRANLILHETAHQWFGDTVTMKWFDDLWLKEGFAEFMAYKTLEKVMPEANAWKVFYERNKQAAYQTDSTKGTTPIYQKIDNLSAAKSAYGNIVYRKAPSFLRQAEFYLGEDKFQTAVRAFLKKHEYANAGWEDLLQEFEDVKIAPLREALTEREISHGSREFAIPNEKKKLERWAQTWLREPGVPIVRATPGKIFPGSVSSAGGSYCCLLQQANNGRKSMSLQVLMRRRDGFDEEIRMEFPDDSSVADTYTSNFMIDAPGLPNENKPLLFFPNYQDYGYGIFLLDNKSRDYVLKNIQNEKDPFLRTMMWGSLWDSVREAELDPKEYVELVVKVLGSGVRSSDFSRPNTAKMPAKAGTPNEETDEGTIQTLLNRVSTAMNYYIGDKRRIGSTLGTLPTGRISASTADLQARLESLLIDRIQNAPTAGQRITYYRAFLSLASTKRARNVLKQILRNGTKRGNPSGSEGSPRDTQTASGTFPTGRVSASTANQTAKSSTGTGAAMNLKTKDRFDIVTRLVILGDPEAPRLLAELEKTEGGDDAKRYAYVAKAGLATVENKAKFWNDFLTNKDISESWIEAAMGPFNSIRHAALTQQYLERALAELPNLKRSRKIFFVNGWLGAFIGGQRDEKALAIVNKFLADNPNLDNDLRLKILENVDTIERAVRIRAKFKVQ